jgi:predicted permease
MRVLDRVLPPDEHDRLRAELLDLYAARVEADGSARAHRWFRKQVLAFVPSFGRRLLRRPRLLPALDLRLALRQLRRSPGFTATATTTLALGIGATTAIYTALDHVVLRPLPYEEPERLVYIDVEMPGEGSVTSWGVTEAGYFHLLEHNRAFEVVGAFGGAETGHQLNIVGSEGGARVSTAYVSATLLDVLRARPALGRLIEERDDGWMGPERGVLTTVVLGYDFWLREYGGDPDVVGTEIRIEGELPVEVLGVMAPGFHLPHNRVDIWLPLGLHPARAPNNSHQYRVIGRLADGVTVDDATADLARLDALLPEAVPAIYTPTFMEESGFRSRLTPLRERVLAGLDQVLWILFGSIALVFAIACANVANLFLARAEAKRRDRAIRRALGVGRLGLAGQVLSESLAISAVAVVVGLWLADLGLRVFVAVAPPNLPRLADIGIGATSWIAALVVGTLAGIAFGGIQLLSGSADPSALRDGGKTASRSGHGARRAIVVAQTALALVLLAGAGVMFRSFERLRDVDPGMDPTDVLMVDVHPPATRLYMQETAVQSLYRDIFARIAALPGVREVSAGGVPMATDNSQCLNAYIEDRPLAAGQQPPCVEQSRVAPGFFRTLGIPLRGREVTWPDTESEVNAYARGEVVVTRALADRFWPGEEAIGKGIRLLRPGQTYARVVGVTGDLYGSGLDAPPSEEVFLQLWSRANTLVVKAAPEAMSALPAAIRRTIGEIDPAIALGTMQTVQEMIATSSSVARASLILLLLGIGAVLGLALSAVGTFGVLAYVVSQRQREIGIRMAIGGHARRVTGMIVGDAFSLVFTGAILGLLGAMVTTRLLRPFLFDVAPNDPYTLVTVTAALVGVGLLASWVPARRAARVDPMVVLKSD